MKKLYIILFSIFSIVQGILFAHNPRIVNENITEVKDPEISQAFYGELNGKEAEFIINSDKEFSLYVGMLVPDVKNIRTDVNAEIYTLKDSKKETLALLDGSKFEWKPYYEEYAQDNYFKGPEYPGKGKEQKGELVPAGNYRIKVYSPTTMGKYVVVVGFLESWPPKTIIKAVIDVPVLKLKFFEEPLFNVIISKFGLIYVFMLFILAGIVWLVSKTVKSVAGRQK